VELNLLNVDDSGQLLHSVEQNVSLLDGGLVLPVLVVRPVRLHNSTDLVYLAVQTASYNESGQFPAKKFVSIINVENMSFYYLSM